LIRSLVRFSVQRRVTVLMIALAVLAFGGVSLSRLSLNLLPEISYPSLTVQTEFPNAAPGEVENLVTVLIEEAVGVIKGLRSLHSVSRPGVSEVTLEFDWGADMDMLALDIREKLDRLIMPDNTERPIVLRYDPALDPIMRLTLSISDPDQVGASLSMMRYVAETKVKDAFERIEGVASARVKGGEEEEIQVNLNQGKVAAMGISPSSLASILSSSNINRPGGSLKGKESQYLVRTLNEYKSVEEIGQLIITPPDQPAVYLREVAEVVRGVKDREEITRVNGVECVVLEIFKEGDANTVQVAETVRASLQHVIRECPPGFKIDLLFDQSRFIKRSIDEVNQSLMIGGILAIIVLLLFLRDLRATVIIAVSIPLSVVATFILMYQTEVSLNIMSLGGLTLGIGMLVDSSIVVLESIHRLRESGMSRMQAAIEGTYEVGGAVIASVLTTVAVFLPIVFVEGIAGQMFRDQSLTVTFSLVSSLIVSLTLLPMLTSLGRKAPSPRSRETKKDQPSMSKLAKFYRNFLTRSLHLRWLVMAIAILVFVASLSLFPRIGRELIPTLSEGEFFFEVSMPEGTPLFATDEVIREMESVALEKDAVAQVYASTGTRNVSGGLSLKTKDENLGQVFVTLRDRSDEQLENRIADELRASYEGIPNLQTKLGRASFFSLKTPIELLFYGENLEELKDYTLELKDRLATIDGITDLRASLESGNPEVNVVFNRQKLASLGFSIQDVSQLLHDRVNGAVVSHFKEEERQIEIRLRNRLEDRNDLQSIENAVIGIRDGVPVPLKSVANLESGRGPAEIHRIQQSRVAILSAEPSGTQSLGDLMARLASEIDAYPPPAGILFELGGQNKEMDASFKSMRFAIILAIFLVYLVMAATFENLLHPFLIMLSIPFALVGVLLGLYFFDQTLSVISMIGTIFLVGVVVNNAIVLIDAINRLRRQGMEKLEAIVEACLIRIRPILMTTLTTVLGLLPMAIGVGEGAELRQPLAIVVCVGLLVSTLLTLIVLPCFYLIVPSKVSHEDLEVEMELELQEESA